jgi:3-oxoacyl-[acyl-carrier-protein] synthase-1
LTNGASSANVLLMGEPRRSTSVVALGAGARTAYGLTALQVVMSARAHKFTPRASHMVDRKGESIATARLMSIGDHVIGIDRFLALGGPALTQAAFPYLTEAGRRSAAPPRLPLFLALPSEARPGFDPRLQHYLLPALAARANVPIDEDRSHLVFGCRGGGAMAFERALAELAEGDAEAVVVGGIDTYFDPDVLEHLDVERRLHGLETENGFIPGEGAAFVLLARRGRSALPRLGRLLSAASANEPHPYGSEEPCLGRGITAAVKQAIAAAGLDQRRLGWVLTDVVNERHRVDEWSYAFARAHAAFTPDVMHDQPLLYTGDLGAASAAMLMAMALTRWQTGCAPAGAALIALHSDGPERGALVASEDVS